MTATRNGHNHSLTFDYDCEPVGRSVLIRADCFEWLGRLSENSIHAVVTDPPYGVKEYDPDQLAKRANRNGGIWRIPPSFDGHTRAPLPRFTALDPRGSLTNRAVLSAAGRQTDRFRPTASVV